MNLPLPIRTPVSGLMNAARAVLAGMPAEPRQSLHRVAKSRNATKSGPGRMPYTRAAGSARRPPSLAADWLERWLDGVPTDNYAEHDKRKSAQRKARELGLSVTEYLASLSSLRRIGGYQDGLVK